MEISLVHAYARSALWVRALLGFFLGLLTAPFTVSIGWYVLFLLAFEIAYVFWIDYDARTRTALVTMSVLGWLTGRALIGDSPMNHFV